MNEPTHGTPRPDSDDTSDTVETPALTPDENRITTEELPTVEVPALGVEGQPVTERDIEKHMRRVATGKKVEHAPAADREITDTEIRAARKIVSGLETAPMPVIKPEDVLAGVRAEEETVEEGDEEAVILRLFRKIFNPSK